MLLTIDTAAEIASVGLVGDGNLLFSAVNEVPNGHAAWLHPAVADLVRSAGIRLAQLDAVAVTEGPGSYTGLRVGLAAAKGYCFALGLPLVLVGSLDVLAAAAAEEALRNGAPRIVPLIDARRMEVFAAVFSSGLQPLEPPRPEILTKKSFENLRNSAPVVFTGSGAAKWQALLAGDWGEDAIFPGTLPQTQAFTRLAWEAWRAGRFADPALAEPAYAKEFHTHAKK